MQALIADTPTQASILARVIDAQPGELTQGAAEYLLSIQFPEVDMTRMDTLSEKSQQGTLTIPEQTELDSYVHVANLLALMQSRARRKLAAVCA